MDVLDVKGNLLALLLGEVRNVMLRTNQAKLFRSPPGETHCIVQLVLGQVNGKLQYGDRSCP